LVLTFQPFLFSAEKNLPPLTVLIVPFCCVRKNVITQKKENQWPYKPQGNACAVEVFTMLYLRRSFYVGQDLAIGDGIWIAKR
jgi:hypothetical protein